MIKSFEILIINPTKKDIKYITNTIIKKYLKNIYKNKKEKGLFQINKTIINL